MSGTVPTNRLISVYSSSGIHIVGYRICDHDAIPVCIPGIVFGVILAAIYNLIAAMTGGIEITLSDAGVTEVIDGLAGRLSRLRLRARAVFEAGEFLEEGQRHVADGAVALLGDDQRRFAFGFLFFLVGVGVIFLADEQADDVGVLLDAAGFAQIAQARAALAVAGALFRITVELGEDDDRDVQFLGQRL